ncbi:MAG: alkaline phosphatase family protein [Acidobacteria bacterium]|jgi:predicted AlkP superfamily pyrophosphatase or phosphodiesterase|nr:alkaline phosphatase family protein [Acidobacteriota bacterium]
MRKTVVLNVVGLTTNLLGASTPHLSKWLKDARLATIKAATPAVTCTAQATYLTGKLPNEHGIVGNGWYFRDECEVKFWRQSNKLIQAPKIWETARAIDPTFTCANLFWWYNMYSTADYSVTPRPMYPANGLKLPDIYTHPATLRSELQTQLGTFPLFDFWGPRTSIKSSQWIADAARLIEQKYNPTLTLIYLPHLDYNLQRLGSSDAAIEKDLLEIDRVCGDLMNFYESREVQIVVLSEYGITDVNMPIHLNRVLREHDLITVREELGLELLDAGASAAFAVADHQIAYVYVNDQSRLRQVREILEQVDGVERVLDETGKREFGLNHPRAGDFVAISRSDAWFTYYYWLDDRKAPDFSRTVDIHRKPGYDPVELFLDPSLKLPQVKVGLTLLKKQLGFRYLMQVIPLDASLVKGSHGRVTDSPGDAPLFATRQTNLFNESSVDATQVHKLILQHLTG